MIQTISRRRFCSTVALTTLALAGSACSARVPPPPQQSAVATSHDGDLTFPASFRWGVATSAYQVEGAVRAAGRGSSIWDAFCDRPGAIVDGSSGAVASDHYHHWKEDLDLMHALGVGSYRFSIAWPRIQPDGRGRVNRRGVDFYQRLVDGLLTRGISPLVTLYHWDLPQTLQDHGGWENRDSAEWFAQYANVLFGAIGDRVDNWLTINEAKIIVQQGYLSGRMAPGMQNPHAAGAVMHHLNLAHGRALAAFRASDAKGRIGPCLQLAPCYPADATAAAQAAAQEAHTFENTLYLDPLLIGHYPTLQHADEGFAEGIRSSIRDGDLAAISAACDFVGVNYYSPVVVDGSGTPVQPHPISAAGWQQLYPQGLRDVLINLHEHYRSPEVIITENGVPDDEADSNEPTVDPSRIRFMQQHLAALHRAIEEGCHVTGYHAWSLLDNFEWTAGYTQRWGLVRVDFDSLARVPKESARWYSKVAVNNKVPAG